MNVRTVISVTIGIISSLPGMSDDWRPPVSLPELVAQPSPEAAAMLRHLDEEISYSEGMAALSIPLYEWTAGDILTSISMRYRISGYRIDERAGWTGLGWNLSGGGCVARTIIGMPDEKQPVEIRNTQKINSGTDGHSYFIDLENHKNDAELDRYSYVCAAGSGSFVIKDGAIIQTPRSNNTIEFTGESKDGVRDFAVTSPDGTRYVFTEREHIDYIYNPGGLTTPVRNDRYFNAVSTWHLSYVISPQGEILTFEYDTISPWMRKESATSGTFSITNRSNEFPHTVVSYDSGMNSIAGSVTTFHDQKILRRIISRTATLEFRHSKRAISFADDIPEKLESIKVLAPDRSCIRDITFEITSYQATPSLLHAIEIRSGGAMLDCHKFSYNHPDITLGKDLFGFGSSKATPGRAIIDFNTGKINEKAAFDPQFANARTLKSHTNALGLVTEYEFEPSDSIKIYVAKNDDSFTIEIPIGIRLCKITDTDKGGYITRIRELTYSGAESDVDFSKIDIISAFTVLSGETRGVPITPVAVSDNNSTCISFLDHSRLPGFPIERATIRYGEVTEHISGTGIGTKIRYVRKYDLSKCRMNFNTAQQPRFGNQTARYLKNIMLPAEGVPAGVSRALNSAGIISGGFEEISGAMPLLVEKMDYEFRNGQYTPLQREEYYYNTVDSASLQTGFFHEAAVRDIINVYGMRKWDWQSTSDFSFADISLTHFSHQLDSVATTRYFANGITRTATTRHLYSEREPSHRPVLKAMGNLPDLPVIVTGETVHNPFGSDTITMATGLRLYVGYRHAEGGKTIEHYTAVSSNISSSLFEKISASGQKTLPVLEVWIADRRDTIAVNTEYSCFGSVYRQTAAYLHSPFGAVMDRQLITGYSPYGKPTGIKEMGKPLNRFEWGTTAGSEDLMFSAESTDGILSLKTRYTHEPLVGCSSIVAPDGSTTCYSYAGSRLMSETWNDGKVVKEYDYGLFCSDGNNYITESTLLNGTTDTIGEFAETATYHNGFGLPRIKEMKNYGSSGNVSTGYSHDALLRTAREWNPLPSVSADEALLSDFPFEAAASIHYSDSHAFKGMTYRASADIAPAGTTLQGYDFSKHPATTEKLCSRYRSGEYRVIRYSCDGKYLRSSGVYSDGELDCIALTDGNGVKTLTFSDAVGNTILVRKVISTGNYADTYTVSDLWGNPLVILPPEASARLNASDSSWLLSEESAIDDYAFMFTYDKALRLKSKKKPGCGYEYYAYDSEGRIAFCRNGNLAAANRCFFSVRDGLGREVLNGTCKDIPSLWTRADGSVSTSVTATLTAKIGEGFLGSGYTLSAEGNVPVLSDARLLTAMYHDNTAFLPAGFASADNEAYSANNGMQTGVLAAISGNTGAEGESDERLLTILRYKTGGFLVSQESVFPDGTRLLSRIEPTVSGLPAKETISLTGDVKLSYTTDYKYDPFGRILSTKTYDTNNSERHIAIVENNLDLVGNIGSTSYNGESLTKTVSHNIRGALTEWSMPMFRQKLAYGSNGIAADWCGRIISKTSDIGEYMGKYDFSYNTLGFLTEARFSSETIPEMDFSTSYSYDTQANLTRIKRNGMLVSDRYGMITDLSISRKGNRICKISVGDTESIPLENQPQIKESDENYNYDACGNLTADPGRGISEIEWNDTGRPVRISFDSGEEIRYRYTSTGKKLSEEFYDADGTLLRRLDFYGDFEFGDGSFDRVLTHGGYISKNGTYHVNVTDYQGNVIGVINATTGIPVQYTDYYPYGVPYGTAYAPEANRRKFGGKELTQEFGVNSSDFGARLYSPLTGNFDSVDPKAENYTQLSPYSYCAADPVNFIDPTGEIPTALEGAYIAQHVYDGKLGDMLYGGWKMIKSYTIRESASFRGGLYQRVCRDGKIEYAFATAGTYFEASNRGINSLKEDWNQLFGKSIDMKASIQIASNISISLRDNELTFVGHSKAGAEAKANAYKTGRNALLYNPAALSAKEYGLDPSSYTGIDRHGIKTFVIKGEFLSKFNNLTKIFTSTAHDKDNYTIILIKRWNNPVGRHKINTLIETLIDHGYH
ncbi:MAG: RHS repeat-associated core domain-containing protein [Muribaculaceae bacterium]|nr:RHS repeat-associated core domain-containing protein [Muribaculaceae bacterium]